MATLHTDAAVLNWPRRGFNYVTCLFDVNSPLTFACPPITDVSSYMPGLGRKPEKERQTDTHKKEQCLTNTGREMTHRFQLSIPRTDEAHAHLSEGLRYPRAGGEKENRGALSDTLSYSLPVRQTFPYLTPTFLVKIFFPSLVCLERIFKDSFLTKA